MGLYTRVDFERDTKDCADRAATLAGMLIRHEIDPMQYREMARRLETLEESYKKKLVITRLVIEDRNSMAKSRLFAWVIGAQVTSGDGRTPVENILSTRRDGKPILCKWAGWSAKYVPVTVARLYNLRSQGVTLMESGGGRGAKKPLSLLETLDEQCPKVVYTKAQGEEIMRRGGMVFFPVEGGAESRDGWLLEALEGEWTYAPGFVFGNGSVQR